MSKILLATAVLAFASEVVAVIEASPMAQASGSVRSLYAAKRDLEAAASSEVEVDAEAAVASPVISLQAYLEALVSGEIELDPALASEIEARLSAFVKALMPTPADIEKLLDERLAALDIGPALKREALTELIDEQLQASLDSKFTDDALTALIDKRIDALGLRTDAAAEAADASPAARKPKGGDAPAAA